MEIPGHWRGGPGEPLELLGETMTCLNRASKYFSLKSNWGLAYFRASQALVLQKSWRISAHQVSFMSAEPLFLSETSSIWNTWGKALTKMQMSRIFFSNRKTSCIFRTHWCMTSGLSLTEKMHWHLSPNSIWSYSFYSKNIVSGWVTLISQLPQNHRMMEW